MFRYEEGAIQRAVIKATETLGYTSLRPQLGHTLHRVFLSWRQWSSFRLSRFSTRHFSSRSQAGFLYTRGCVPAANLASVKFFCQVINIPSDFENLASLARPFFLPSPLPLSARACAIRKNGLVHETNQLALGYINQERTFSPDSVLQAWDRSDCFIISCFNITLYV